ncbi:MAG: hypothetical protein KGI90_01065 [Burkholderiales bacterium]|nr:hypothetical protein [Burkholderiales bacterium]MDE2274747.1 hypothetical protein [Burkholderiales bacterium]
MLEGLKRWFAGGPDAPSQDWDGIAPWARQKQYAFRGVHSEGFVIDGRLGPTPWRLEWGPSQRPYIPGRELRLRAELGLGADLQVVVMNRELQESMEKAVFDQYVEGVQTRIDNQTPPEMRWLVMFPKLAGTEMPLLRERFVALASVKGWLMQWLEGPLSQSLAVLRLEPATPFVLMIGRGRLMLRTALPDAEIESLQAWLRLFELAMREARRVAAAPGEAGPPSSAPSLWPTSALPGDERHK